MRGLTEPRFQDPLQYVLSHLRRSGDSTLTSSMGSEGPAKVLTGLRRAGRVARLRNMSQARSRSGRSGSSSARI